MKYSSSLIASTTVLLLLLWILNLRPKYVFAPLAAAATFFLYQYITVDRIKKRDSHPMNRIFTFSLHKGVITKLIILLYGLSISIVYFIPPFTDRYILDWCAIPYSSWIRLATSIPLLIFFPGYAINYTLRRGVIRGDILETFCFSYLFSIFLNPLITFILWVTGVYPINSQLYLLVFHMTLLNLLLIIHLFKIARAHEGGVQLTVKIDKKKVYKYLALLFIALIVLAASYRMFLLPPYIMGDQWHYFSDAIGYFRNGDLTELYHKNWFFSPLLASFFTLSGFPPINGYFTLNFLNLLPLLSFYLLIKSIFKDRRLQLITTLFTLFSGFGWAYFVFLREVIMLPISLQDNLKFTSFMTYDVWFSNTYLISSFPEVNTSLQVMAFPALMIGVYASKCLKTSQLRFIVLSTAIVVAYTSHIAEAGMMVVTILLISVLSKNVKASFFDGLAFILGLIIIWWIDTNTPTQMFTSLKTFYLTFTISALIPLAAFLASKLSIRKSPLLMRAYLKLGRKSIIGLTVLLIIFLILCFTIWFSNTATAYTLWMYPKTLFSWFLIWSEHSKIIPWYMYPVHLGVIIILAAIGGICLLSRSRKESDNRFDFFLAFSIVSLLLSIAAKYPTLRSITPIEEHRQNKYFSIGLSGFAAYGTLRILNSLHYRRGGSYYAPLLFGLIVVSGISSPFLYVEYNILAFTGPNYFFHSHTLSQDEIDSIEWLRLNLPSNHSVAIIGPSRIDPDEGGNYFKIAWLEGIEESRVVSIESEIQKGDPSLLTEFFDEEKVQYIYLTKGDYEFLQDLALQRNKVASIILRLSLTDTAFANDDVLILKADGLKTQV